MISQNTIAQFLNKPCDVHNWVKALRVEDLDEQIAKLNPKPNLTSELKPRQKGCFLLGLAYPQFYFMCDMGFGKTLLTLELLRYYIQVGRIKKWAVVLVPMDELVDGWEEEIQRWMPDLPYRLLLGQSADKWATLESFETGVVIGTYVGVSAMMCEIRRRQKGDKIVGKRRPVPELVDQFKVNVDALVLDQASKVGSVETLSYEITSVLAKHAKIRYALAGRSFGRDPIKLWSQFYLTDGGVTLTPNLSLYREAFFDKKKSWFGGPRTFEYKFRKKMEPQLNRILQHRSIYYSREECDDLPPRTAIIKRVSFPDDMKQYYKRVVAEALVNRNNFREMENSFSKMRQICSGFVSFVDSEGNKIQMDFKYNPKMDMIFELMDDMPEDSKALIYYEFTYSGRKLCTELKKRKIKHGWLWAQTPNWPEMKKAFDTDPEFKVLVIQSKKGSMGLNLQASDYTFYYENPASAIDRDESERRNWRTGQKKHVFCYDIVVKESIEESLLSYHKEGKSIFEALVKNPSQVLKAA